MIGKFVLAALVCVSVAQAQGGDLENVIKNGLRRAEAMNQKGLNRFEEATNGAYMSIHLIDRNTKRLTDKSQRMQDSSTAAITRFADVVERKARQANRPESVFECIRANEDSANREIESITRRFGMGYNNLRGFKTANIFTATTAFERMTGELTAKYEKTVRTIHNCFDRRCVYTALGNFASSLNSMYASVRRVEGQIATIFANYERDASNYLRTNTAQVNRVKSYAVKYIIRCFFNGERDFVDSEE